MDTDIKMLEFGTADIENIFEKISSDEIDKLRFGAIQLDAKGTILHYNSMEGVIAGLDPRAVIGKNFFTEVAPCTNTPIFKGAFDQGVQCGNLKTMFEYTYDFREKPVDVAVRMVRVNMKKSFVGETYWIFVQVL